MITLVEGDATAAQTQESAAAATVLQGATAINNSAASSTGATGAGLKARKIKMDLTAHGLDSSSVRLLIPIRKNFAVNWQSKGSKGSHSA